MNVTRRTRPVLDVSQLPDIAFGPPDIMWWGTLGFVVIEGWTLVLCTAIYLYLTQNYATWPPEGTPRPSLVVPTISMLLMLASLPLIIRIQHAARRFDIGRVKRGLAFAAVLNLAFVLLRCWELLRSLNVKWDTNAYGSAQWLMLVMHGTLLLVEFVEVAGMALIFWVGHVEEKHCSDAADISFYWKFMVLVWVPMYLLCFWLPRWP
ncbi:MAG: cytochrome c oxidase subunit [Gemmatimonadetes bacterium]|jgi:cytochrome c oxidase subunit 3|nr:cytochrome c oxidase subunit [Gemmatimonadota bacterium]